GISALPASMVLETMAQAAGLLVAATVPAPSLPVLAKVQPFSAHGLARPGDCVTVDARLEDVREEGCRTTVTAAVGGRLLAAATARSGRTSSRRHAPFATACSRGWTRPPISACSHGAFPAASR